MKLGFFTAILRNWDFEKVLEWASRNDFSVVEVYAAPNSKHINPAKELDKAPEIKKLLDKYGTGISAISYHPNNLDPDLDKRKKFHEHLKYCIDMAYKLEVGVVSTFIGSPAHFLTLELDKALNEFRTVFGNLTKYAEDRGVKIAIENCPMGGWNLAYSPVMWRTLFEIVPSDSLGLNFDPSHLVWQFVDYIRAVREFRNKVFHVHAKDTEVNYERLTECGIYGRGWWRYRIPGWGEIDWRGFLSALREVGYNYVISVEHEDPVFGPEEGLILAKKYLSQMIP